MTKQQRRENRPSGPLRWPSSPSEVWGAIAVPLRLLVAAVGLGTAFAIAAVPGWVAVMSMPPVVAVGVAWGALISVSAALGLWWFLAPDQGAQFLRGDRVVHVSGRRGWVLASAGNYFVEVKWLDTWNVRRVAAADLEIDYNE